MELDKEYSTLRPFRFTMDGIRVHTPEGFLLDTHMRFHKPYAAFEPRLWISIVVKNSDERELMNMSVDTQATILRFLKAASPHLPHGFTPIIGDIVKITDPDIRMERRQGGALGETEHHRFMGAIGTFH